MGILKIIKQYLNIIIGLLVASLTFFLASIYYNHKINKINLDFTNYRTVTEKNISEQKISILEQNNKIKEENLTLSNKLKEVENEKYTQYQALQKSNTDLKLAISNGSKRLYINADCAATTNNSDTKEQNQSSSSVDNGSTSKAVINSGDATAIISITDKGDKYKSQLEALQEWVNKLVLENNK